MCFMAYMFGNSIQLFSIYMIFNLLSTPIAAIMSSGQGEEHGNGLSGGSNRTQTDLTIKPGPWPTPSSTQSSSATTSGHS
jgi:hypothetical protein